MIAGLDIGNSTTELALWDEAAGPAHAAILVARQRTRGEKGSEESLVAAAELLTNVERRNGVRADALALCELAPARMLTLDPLRAWREDAGVIRIDRATSSTPGGEGCGVGVHVGLARLAGAVSSEPVVVSVPASVPFEDAAAAIRQAQSRGWHVAAVLVASDEGVLVANRLAHPVPVVDEAALDLIPDGRRVVVEVVGPGRSPSTIGDPLALATALDLGAEALERLTPFTRALSSVRSAAVTTGSRLEAEDAPEPGWAVEYATPDGTTRRLELPSESERAESPPVGMSRRLTLEGGAADTVGSAVSDVFVVGLPAVSREVRLRPGTVRLDATLLASLGVAPPVSVAERLAELTGRPVHVAGPEAMAARRGALTTPNAPADALVCDMGGGTIDLVGADGHAVAAGAGELLTSTVAYALGVSRIAAEYIKRGASVRMETELLAHHESGERVFRARPVPAAAVSWLCAEGPGRLLPFSRTLAPGEWRALRLALKEHVVGANIRRCMEAIGSSAAPLLLCGGTAGDDELVAAVTDGLNHLGIPVSRANVAGRWGPRYAVAIGAALSLAAVEGEVT